MLIPKQVLGNDNKVPATPRPSNVFDAAFDLARKVDEASKKLPPRKLKIKTAYGEYEVKHEGKATKRVVDNYREMLEEEGRKQGWQREDGTVTDTKADFSKTTPKQYEQAKKAVNQQPRQQQKEEPKAKVNTRAQSRVDAFAQSIAEPTPMQEYTGGDPNLVRDSQGRGKTSSAIRKMAPKEEGVNVGDETKRILQGVEDAVIAATPSGRVQQFAKSILGNVSEWNQRQATPDPLLNMAVGSAEGVVNPLSTFSAATGNLYDSSATLEERLGAAGNIVGYALGAEGNIGAAMRGAKALEGAAAKGVRGLKNRRDIKANSGINDMAPASLRQDVKFGQPSSFEEFRKGAQGVEPPPPSTTVQALEISPSSTIVGTKSPSKMTDDELINAVKQIPIPERPASPIFKEYDSRRDAIRAKANAKTAEQPAIKTSVDNFVASMTPAQSAKAKNALNMNMLFDGKLYSRKDFIEKAVLDGRTVQTLANGKRRLVSASGSFLDESQISKTAMDYAEHLIKNPAKKNPIPSTPPTKQTLEASPSAGLFSAKPNVIDPKKAETGKPTVVKVFHGSADLRFTESGDWSKPGDVYGGSVFFTDNPKIAKTYADDRRAWDYQNAEPGVIQRYVELKNPKVIDAQGAVWKDTNDAIELARAEGHDGIIIKNVRDAYNSLENPKVNIPATNVVVFDKSRIHKGLDTIDGVSVPPTKPTLETPGVTTSAPMAEAKAAKAPQKVAGVSNNIQLTKVEEGILKESPVGKGMTKQEFQAKVEDAGRRIDAGEVNPSAVADAVERGEVKWASPEYSRRSYKELQAQEKWKAKNPPTEAEAKAWRDKNLVYVNPSADEVLGVNERGQTIHWSNDANTYYSVDKEGRIRTAPWIEGLSDAAIDRLDELTEPKLSSPKPDIPTARPAQAPVDAPTTSAQRNVTGVSNNIQLTKVEEGILKESPVGKGMTKQEFQAKVEDAGRRIDSGEVNPSAVADAVENGKALDTDDLAVVQAGNRRFEADTTKLQDQLDAAIAKGDDATIVSIQKQVDKSRKDHLEFLEKVQKGKSEWSNVGRLMAQGMDVDSDTLTGVVANAERIAGKKFKDIDPNIATKLDEIGTQLEDITKKLDAAQAENKRLQKLIEDGKAPGFKRAEIQVRREKAISNIRSKWVENKPEARISSDPFMAGRTLDELQRLAKIAPDVVELAKTYIAEGADAVADILKRIKKDTDVDLTEDDFNLVLSGEYRQFKSPKVEDAVNFEDVNKAFAKMVNDEKLADLRKQARTAPIAQRSRIQKSIRKLEVQIKQQQLPNARAKAQIDADTQRLIEKRESARVQRDDIYAQLKDKRERELHPTKTFLLELVNAPKSVVLSLDNSAPMTHGAFVLGSHPITWLKATSKSIGAFLKEENRVKALAEIRSDPYFDKAVGAGKVKGLAMRDLNDAAPYSGIVGRIPILGKPFKASDRAMEVFGAKVRLELFKSYAKAEESGWLTRFYKANPDYAAIGEAVNTMTGRGTGKAAEGAGKLFGTVATAPTYTVSRFKLAMGTPFFNAAIRKQPVLAARVLADYTKYVGATVTGLVAAQRYGLEVDWDESSSNYLKYKIPGTNVWIDPNGGILQPVRLALQMKTKDPAVTGGFFIAGKTSPLPRSMMNLQAGLRGKKQFGKSYDPATPEGKLNLLFQFAPLSIQNMTEIKNEQNLTAEQKTALAIASFFGANVNVKEGTDKK